jgi:hypothetical protein
MIALRADYGAAREGFAASMFRHADEAPGNVEAGAAHRPPKPWTTLWTTTLARTLASASAWQGLDC